MPEARQLASESDQAGLGARLASFSRIGTAAQDISDGVCAHPEPLDRERSREDGDGGGRDAGNPHRLADRLRPDLAEPLDDLRRKPRDGRVPEIRLECGVLLARALRDLRFLPLQIPFVLQRRLDAGNVEPAHWLLEPESASATRSPSFVAGCRSHCSAGIAARRGIFHRRLLAVVAKFSSNRDSPRLKTLPSLIIDQPDFAPLWRESQVRVVHSQQQAILGARRKHPIRLQTTFRY